MVKTPTLRNLDLTGPYMHNGRLDTLGQVLDFYENAGPVPQHFEGRTDFPVFRISADERRDLIAFLQALNGEPQRVARPPLPE
jgi:cytochrome c peroxidase